MCKIQFVVKIVPKFKTLQIPDCSGKRIKIQINMPNGKNSLLRETLNKIQEQSIYISKYRLCITYNGGAEFTPAATKKGGRVPSVLCRPATTVTLGDCEGPPMHEVSQGGQRSGPVGRHVQEGGDSLPPGLVLVRPLVELLMLHGEYCEPPSPPPKS